MASTLRARPPSPPINQVLVEEDDPAADDEGDEGRLGRAGELGWSCAEPVGEVTVVESKGAVAAGLAAATLAVAAACMVVRR